MVVGYPRHKYISQKPYGRLYSVRENEKIWLVQEAVAQNTAWWNSAGQLGNPHEHDDEIIYAFGYPEITILIACWHKMAQEKRALQGPLKK